MIVSNFLMPFACFFIMCEFGEFYFRVFASRPTSIDDKDHTDNRAYVVENE